MMLKSQGDLAMILDNSGPISGKGRPLRYRDFSTSCPQMSGLGASCDTVRSGRFLTLILDAK